MKAGIASNQWSFSQTSASGKQTDVPMAGVGLKEDPAY